MQAVVLNEDGVTLDTHYPVPVPQEDEVLVRVLRAGICETDLQLIQGYMGYRGVLGHEFVGVAESGKWQGQRVVGEINCSCHHCEYCRKGLSNHCPDRTVLGILHHDGVFADYVAVPARNLHRVPNSVSTDEAVFAEPLAAAFQVPMQISLQCEQRVIILGDGRLGNLCAQVVNQYGCNLQVLGKHRWKLAYLDRLGISTALVSDVSPRREADVVVDCTGSPNGFTAALCWLKPRGTIVLKTSLATEHRLTLAPLVIDEITVVGSRCGPFPPALEALEAKRIDVLPLVSERFPLAQALTAIAAARSNNVLKVLLDVAGNDDMADKEKVSDFV